MGSPIEFSHPPGSLVDVGERRLWVEREGAGPPLILIGGYGPAGSHVVFHPHFSNLADELQIVYFDLFSRGRSEKADDLSKITFASDVQDVVGLLDALDIGPAHLYGFSYGGLLAQSVALDHPDKVATLTVANSLHSPHMWQLNHENLNRELRNQLPEVWEQIEDLRRRGKVATDPELRPLLSTISSLARFFNPDNAGRIATETGDRNVELYPLFVGADIDFVIGGQVAQLPDFRTRLPTLSVPMQVLAGRFDRALYPSLQRDFERLVPRCQLHILERSGSFAHVEEPDRVAHYLREFINSYTQNLSLPNSC